MQIQVVVEQRTVALAFEFLPSGSTSKVVPVDRRSQTIANDFRRNRAMLYRAAMELELASLGELWVIYVGSDWRVTIELLTGSTGEVKRATQLAETVGAKLLAE